MKVALVKDGAFFDAIERAAPVGPRARPRRRRGDHRPLRRTASATHRRGGDPFELTLARPLDFGHWAAHKLEQLSAYELRHGEAVAIGVALDTVYSALAGHLPAKDADRVLACLRALGLPTDHPLLEHPELAAGLDEFREHLGGQLTISLLNAIGSGFGPTKSIRAASPGRSPISALSTERPSPGFYSSLLTRTSPEFRHAPIPADRSKILDLYFLEHRAKLLDLAAFLDRYDRAGERVISASTPSATRSGS